MIGEIGNEDMAAAINELLLYSHNVRLEFPRDLHDMLRKYIKFLEDDPNLYVVTYMNVDNVTVRIEVKDK